MKKFKTVYSHSIPIKKGFGPSMTDQQYRDECDINSIIGRYIKTGKVPTSREGISGNFADIGDFQSCLERITLAKNEFDALPSSLRSRFGNDPVAYVDFVLNPANNEECVKLGFRVKPTKEDTPLDALHRIENSLNKEKVTVETGKAV